jgi:outer membrane protein W
MKPYKIILLVLSALVMGTAANAQLMERDNVNARIAAGTRPQQGDFGFMFGASIEEVREILDDELSIRGFPLMSFKYYFTDNLEFRLNTQSYAKSKSIQGTLNNQLGVEDDVEKESFIRFMPSAQYHFASTNLMDTYGGIGLIVGSEKNQVITSEKTSVTGDYFATSMTKKTFVTGFNINFGLQAFIADLPISLGVEASLRGLKHSNLQYENNFKSSVGGVETSQTYYTVDKASSQKYESLEYKSFDLGADVRVMLSYYFRK